MCAAKVIEDNEVVTDKAGQPKRPCYKCLVCNWNSKLLPTWADAEWALFTHLLSSGNNEAACELWWTKAKENAETITTCVHVEASAQVHPRPRMTEQLDFTWKTDGEMDSMDPNEMMEGGHGPPEWKVWWPAINAGNPPNQPRARADRRATQTRAREREKAKHLRGLRGGGTML